MMSEISRPSQLSGADSVLSLVTLFQKILDPKEREKISEDIVNFHKLNEDEAQKAIEARATLKKHSDIMAENTRTLNQIEFERKDFKQFMETEKAKLEDKKNAVADLQKKAQELHESSIDRLNQAVAKENDLKTAQAQHVANVKSLGEREADLKKERADLDEYKKKTDALAAETQAKMEKLKQFIS